MRKLINRSKDGRWALHIANQHNDWIEPHWIDDEEWFYIYVIE